ncbi:MAG TPA: hypothetical protein VFS77_15105, partial [Pyrinomonadaceae bacterium]|nr:hypothetical protein [Pyrinomonadaceae bacterium]
MKFWCLLVSIAALIFITQQQSTPQPETVVLSEKAPLGKVTFSHLNHTSKNYNVEGTRPVYCTECHHVEQPVAEAKK